MSNENVHQIFVFPNSGHHYTFIPFSEKLNIELRKKLEKLCKQERAPWFALGHSWMRGRYGLDSDRNPGLWVAVESNLGTVKRGSTYSPQRQIPADEVPEDSDLWKQSPYAYPSEDRLPESSDENEVIPVTIPIPGDGNQRLEIAKIQVIWRVPAGETIDVDLVVDFGNTRTVALALEHCAAQNGKLAAICRPLRFIKRGTEYTESSGKSDGDPSVIVDSWFVLHEPTFADCDPPSPKFAPVKEFDVEEVAQKGLMRKKSEKQAKVTERVPQMFLEYSPVVMGEDARNILGSIPLEHGGSYSLSSPKRYTWDSSSVGKQGEGYWTMVLNRWNPKSKNLAALPVLQGAFLRFLYEDGRNWEIENPPNENTTGVSAPISNPQQPAYPRKDAMCWAALSILEAAFRQITSEEWRKGNQPFVPRRIRNISVTYPSGWIEEETTTYREMWQRAIDIHALINFQNTNHFNAGGSRPNLSMDLDEAVASQLPLVYSEIKRLGDIGENWIGLYGRGANDDDSKIRIMTIDIGGGTTDISVVEYTDDLAGAGIALKYKPIFKDSNSYAGDGLAKEVIERVLLPALAGAKSLDEDHEDADIFENIFGAALQKEADKQKWSRIVKLVFLPIVRQWLRDLTEGTFGNPDTSKPWAPDELEGTEGKLIDIRALNELNGFCEEAGLGSNFLDPVESLKYQPSVLKECIRDSLRPGLEPLAKYVTAFDVDLVSLSGKPSELPQVKELLDEILPILPQRIIPLKNYSAGDWYPMSGNRKISDAKTVTAVGAALHSAIQNGLIQGWSIIRDDSDTEVVRNYWGLMPPDSEATGFGTSEPYLDANVDEASNLKLLINSYIGRMRYKSEGSRPEQQYKLVWKNPEKWNNSNIGSMLSVDLLRVTDPESGNDIGLKLGENVELIGADLEINSEDIELQLCTLEGGEFWIDSGRFEVQW
jgi:hypothetical protein